MPLYLVNIHIDGKKIEQVDTFTYLGSLLIDDYRAEK